MRAATQISPHHINRILAALPVAEYERLAPHLRRVKLTQNNILYDAGEEVRQAYFLQSGVVSLIAVTDESENIEAGIIGYEGMVGIAGILRYHRAPFQVIVQIQGEALSIETSVLRREFKQGGELQDIILCFTHTLVSQLGQAMVCNRFHTIDKRLSRWLLMTRDRALTDTFHLTHEFLSYMLGAGRTDVTKAAGALQDAGLIRYRRGVMMILDEKGLEAATCACYRAMKEETAHFLAA